MGNTPVAPRDQKVQDREMAWECCKLANVLLETGLRQSAPEQSVSFQKALHYFMLALELEPRCLDAYLGLAYLSALLNVYDRAHDALAQALELAPSDPRLGVLHKEIQTLEQTGPKVLKPELNNIAAVIQGIEFQQLSSAQLLRQSQTVLNHLGLLSDSTAQAES